MKNPFHAKPFVAVLFVIGCCITPVAADLPTLTEKPWDRYFAALETRKFTYTVDTWARGKITPMGTSGKAVADKIQPTVTFVIEETLPTGKTSTKQINNASLETPAKPIVKQGKTIIRGKVTGDASFEGFLEFEKGAILVGGRLLEPGTLTKNPLRFGVQVTFPSAYTYTKKEEKDDAKKFAKTLKDDNYAMIWTDGKKVKFQGDDKVDPESKAANGPGIADLKVEISAYQERTFELKADPNSKMMLSARQEQQFHEGFSVTWYPDPAKDPQAKARLAIEIK